MQTGVVVMSCKWEGSRGVILCAVVHTVVHTELYGVRRNKLDYAMLVPGGGDVMQLRGLVGVTVQPLQAVGV